MATSPSSAPIQELSREFNFEYLWLADAGNALYEKAPDQVSSMVATAQQLIYRDKGWREDNEWLGSGVQGHVYGIPSLDNVCLKIVSSNTMEGVFRTGIASRIPDLTLEARYMENVGQRLNQRKDHGVKAPKQFGVVRFERGSAILQERVPFRFVTFHHLLGRTECDEDRDHIKEQGVLAVDRTRRALGRSCLRLGAGDMRGRNGLYNAGNFMVDRDKMAEGNEMYVLDLVGNLFRNRKLAALANRTYGLIPHSNRRKHANNLVNLT